MGEGDGLRKSARSELHRRAARGSRDRAIVEAIIDEAMACHVAFVEDGQPVVIPATPWRVGQSLYLHGAARSRLIRVVGDGAPICVSMAMVDGLIFAGSAASHSTDFRSVVLFGQGEVVTDASEKAALLRALVDKLSPGRSDTVRAPTEAELAATGVVRLLIDEGAAKVRSAPPTADPHDPPVWIGTIPMRIVAGAPIPVGDSATLTPPPLPAWLPRG